MPGTCRFRQFFVDVSASGDPTVPILDGSLAPAS